MRRLLLVSSSATHGSGYLEHCEAELRALFGDACRVLFVPYALKDHGAYAGTARKRFTEMGYELDSIHEAADPAAAVQQAQGIFIGGGNTFRLLKRLYDEQLIEPIRRRVHGGMPYMGTSAGSNIACLSIRTTNDMPIVQPPTFDALQLLPFQLNPHYIDADPSSTHMGETRETRLREFHEENETPVVAIREGSMLVVRDDTMTLAGSTGGKLFRQGQEPSELDPGASLDERLR